MSEINYHNQIETRNLAIQQGDQNIQHNIFKTEIRYGDDPEEKSHENYDFNPDSPYQGLEQFTSDDSSRFYGRNKLTEDLFSGLKEKNLLILLGASGSGKSSLVRAGLISKFSAENKGNFSRFILVPNESPFFSFYGQIITFVSTNNKQYKQSDAQVALPPSKVNTEEDLQSALNFLIRVVTHLKKDSDSKWLIFIDQFEEIFTRTSEFERGLFIGSLRSLIDYLRESRDKSVKIILAMRTDFLDQLMNEFPDFVLAIQDGGKEPFSYVTPMTDRELKLVIKNPAATHGVNVERDLIEEVINDFRGESRSLPLLQYTLDLLWKSDNLSDTLLNKETYENLGRVGGALQQQAEKIYQQFEDQGQGKLVEDIFWNLVTITGDGKRVSKREEKSRFINMGGEAIVDELIQEHRLLISGRQTDTVEIAHEALISSWSRLQEWINTHEEKIVLERQLREAAEGWAKFKDDVQKASGELWIGSKLERIFELRVLGLAEQNLSSDLPESNFKKTVEAFVKASIDLRDREKREKDEQIKKLNLALTETSLREKSARVLNLLPTQPLNALLLAIQTMGENLDRMPEEIFSVVQTSLHEVLEGSIGKIAVYFQGHEGGVSSVAFSPDGTKIVSRGRDGTVHLWNLEGNLIGSLCQHHEGGVNSVAFSPDGTKIVSGGCNGTICLWNLEGNLIGYPFQGHEGGVNSVSFSPDGTKIASAGYDTVVRLWDLEGNSLEETFQGHRRGEPSWWGNSGINSVSFSPDGTKIASGGGDGTVCLWDLNGNLIGHPFEGKVAVNSVAFNPDGTEIAIGCDDNAVYLRDLNGNFIGEKFYGHPSVVSGQAPSGVNSVAFSPNSIEIASGCDDNMVYWSDSKGNSTRQPFWHKYDRDRNFLGCHITSVAFNPEGTKIVSGSSSGTICWWDLENSSVGKPFRGHLSRVCAVTFSSDGTMIASGGGIESNALFDFNAKSNIRLWNLKGKPVGQPFQVDRGFIHSVVFSRDGTKIVSGSDEQIRLWNLGGSNIGESFRGHKERITSVAFSPDDSKIVSGSFDKTICLWTIKGHLIVEPIQHEDFVNSVTFSPDGTKIASGASDMIYLWDLEGNLIEQSFQGHEGNVNSVAFSPDGTSIVSGGSDGTVRLWDCEGHCIGSPFRGHKQYVTSVAFSPDGTSIVSGGGDCTVRLSDLKGEPIGKSFQGHIDRVESVAFSPDSTIVISGSFDRTIRLWRAHWQLWLQLCCNRLKYHPAFLNPQTEEEKQAKATAEKYIFTSRLGAQELYDKALRYIQEKDFTIGITLLNHAVSCHPAYTQAYFQRGVVYYQIKSYFNAIKNFNHVLANQPKLASAYYYRGVCYRQINDLEQAKSDLQKTIKLYQQQGKQKEAYQVQELLRKFLQ
jgi:WD40 repeat protein/Tfp pilus assembly protein PilF/energy-coupling factor transporter ATP-binding protein EcfA2